MNNSKYVKSLVNSAIEKLNKTVDSQEAIVEEILHLTKSMSEKAVTKAIRYRDMMRKLKQEKKLKQQQDREKEEQKKAEADAKAEMLKQQELARLQREAAAAQAAAQPAVPAVQAAPGTPPTANRAQKGYNNATQMQTTNGAQTQIAGAGAGTPAKNTVIPGSPPPILPATQPAVTMQKQTQKNAGNSPVQTSNNGTQKNTPIQKNQGVQSPVPPVQPQQTNP